VQEVSFAHRGLVSYLPPENGWQPLDAYTRATPEEPGETPWGEGHDWHVAERQATGKAGVPGWVSAKRTCGPPARLAPMQAYTSV
jgi:hypothetical protein